MTQQMDALVQTFVLAQQAPSTSPPASAQPTMQASEPVPVGVPGAVASPAQTSAPGSTATGPAAKPTAPNMDFMWIMMVLVLVMVVMTSLGGRKERKKRQELLNSLKKQDKVITTGGVIGTVVDLTDDEVVIRVEEGRIRFSRSAVAQIVRPSATGAEKPAIAGAA